MINVSVWSKPDFHALPFRTINSALFWLAINKACSAAFSEHLDPSVGNNILSYILSHLF